MLIFIVDFVLLNWEERLVIEESYLSYLRRETKYSSMSCFSSTVDSARLSSRLTSSSLELPSSKSSDYTVSNSSYSEVMDSRLYM